MTRFSRSRTEAKKGVDSRAKNTRPEQEPANSTRTVVFSFRDFDKSQIPPGQSFEEWEKEGLLSKLCNTLYEISSLTMLEAIQKQYITKYGPFPKESEFNIPKKLDDQPLAWGKIDRIADGKCRVGGHIAGNVFFIVFLDKNHVFYITKKKHT